MTLVKLRQLRQVNASVEATVMKQILIKEGSVIVDEVAAPGVSLNRVLVSVGYSCISTGTELAGVANSGLPLYRRALKHPEHALRVFEMMKDQGMRRTLDRVMGKLESGLPNGYLDARRVI